MWLRDGLPKDLPNTRIFTYGYDTQLQGSLSIKNLTDVGICLRAALNDFFQTANVSSHPCMSYIRAASILLISFFFSQKKPDRCR